MYAGKRGALGGPKAGSSNSLRQCYTLTVVATIIIGVVLFYVYIFAGIKRINENPPEPGSTGDRILQDIKKARHKLGDMLTDHSCNCEAETAKAMETAGVADPDAWLDTVHEKPPAMEPSHYAQVHGVEPFERGNMKPWELHVIPGDDWYDKAKKATDRCDLELTYQTVGAEKGLADKVVWVTGLFDLNRQELTEFKRPLQEYYDRFNRILDRGFEMIVYIPAHFEPHLRLKKDKHFVIHMNASELNTYFPYWDRVQAIRTSKLWTQQGDITGWLSKSPQARLPQYNPLVMSKLSLLRDAARINPFGSRYHMFMDAGHLCATEQNPTPEGTSMYRQQMSNGMFVTHWPYGTTTEVHGLTDKAMHIYMAQAEDPLRIVRGGIFGGQLPHIECVLKAYNIAMHQTLADGYMGTEECIWAIIHKRFPHLFDSFDNNSLGNHGDNCASFQKAMMVEREIKGGKEKAFVSPAIPEYPSWWDEAQRSASKGGAAAGGKVGGKAGKQLSALRRVGGVNTGAKVQVMRG